MISTRAGRMQKAMCNSGIRTVPDSTLGPEPTPGG
jgi:hypothetical protein